MSERKDIIDGSLAATSNFGLIYTELLGWVDLGHARGDDIKLLMAQFDHGEQSSEDYFEVKYQQFMVGHGVKALKTIRWNIKKGLTRDEKISIALAMMIKTAHLFEAFQSN